MVQNSMVRNFCARADYAVKCLQEQPTIWWKTRDATKTASSGNRSESHPGAVDCSLAVTNNSPVWRPQGTHGEVYPCITWCSWLFTSSD